jgi:PAS domain S-box-containing protein
MALNSAGFCKIDYLTFIEPRKPILAGIVVFAIILLLTQLLAYQRYLIFQETQKQKLVREATAVKDQLGKALRYSLSATKTLAFIVRQYGAPENFDSVAADILQSNPYIDALQLTRKGVITHVYPLKGNEAVIGYDVFQDSLRNKEAFKALEKKQLYFAGPFELKQRGTAVVGRLPVFQNDEFFGFSVVIIRLSTLINAAGMEHPGSQFTYQLSKINPDTGKEEFFLPGPTHAEHGLAFSVEVPDGEWKLAVIPKADYYEIPSGFFISVIGLLFSATAGLFAWHLARQPEKLNYLVEQKASEVIQLQRNAVDTIERVSDAFVSLDENWCYTYMNKKAGEIFGRNPQKMIGKHIWTEFPEGVGQPFYHAYHQSMREQKYTYLEEYYDPYDQWFENHIYPSPKGLSIYFRNITESKKAARRLEASERYFRTLIEKSTDAVVLFDGTGRIIYHSPSTERITGFKYDEIHNKRTPDFVESGGEGIFQKVLHDLAQVPGGSTKTTFRFRHKEGHYLWIEGTCTNWLHDENIQAIVLNYHDITGRVEAEEKIRSANRFYHFTSRINEMMIHARSEEHVYHEVCKIAVEVGKFKMAWIGKIDAKRNVVVPMAFAGSEEGYISGGKEFSLDDPVVMAGPTATAIREGVYFYCNDIENDPAMKTWAVDALRRGYRASIALPIMKSKTAVGIFHIYSEEKFCFDDNEIALLEDATRNISFTLHGLEKEELRIEAEKQIVNEKLLSDSIINSLPGVFYLFGIDGKFVRWNSNFEHVTGYSATEIKEMHPLDFFEGDDRSRVKETIRAVFETGHAEVTAYFSTRNGGRIPYYYNGTKTYFENVEYLIGMGIDISPRVQAENELMERTEEIQKLTEYLQNIREEERTHISREIHDVIGQQLTAMKMDASWVRKKVSGDEIAERLAGLIALIDETIQTVRRISAELRPVMLDDFGLASALEWQTSEFSKHTGIHASFINKFGEIELPGDLATNVFRVFQEALTNVARHSGATEVQAILKRKDNVLQLTVRDNGRGFDISQVGKKRSLGLVGMKERARMFDGSLSFLPNSPSGTTVELSIPLKSKVDVPV